MSFIESQTLFENAHCDSPPPASIHVLWVDIQLDRAPGWLIDFADFAEYRMRQRQDPTSRLQKNLPSFTSKQAETKTTTNNTTRQNSRWFQQVTRAYWDAPGDSFGVPWRSLMGLLGFSWGFLVDFYRFLGCLLGVSWGFLGRLLRLPGTIQ